MIRYLQRIAQKLLTPIRLSPILAPPFVKGRLGGIFIKAVT